MDTLPKRSIMGDFAISEGFDLGSSSPSPPLLPLDLSRAFALQLALCLCYTPLLQVKVPVRHKKRVQMDDRHAVHHGDGKP